MRQRQRGVQHLAKDAVLEVQRRGATPRLWLQELRRKFGASVSSTQRKVSETLEARLHCRHPGRGGERAPQLSNDALLPLDSRLGLSDSAAPCKG